MCGFVLISVPFFRVPVIRPSENHMPDTPSTTRAIPFLPLLVLVALAWLPPGLFGHEPWKPDEGYSIGIIKNMAETGDYVVPRVVDTPFMEKPPVFFITAALFAKILSPHLLPLHQAAALAAAFYLAILILFTYLAGKEKGGRDEGSVAALALLGCVGLTVRAHSAITDTALWCGFAIAGYGMVLAERRRYAAAFWFGTGSGLTFLAKGLQGPAFLGVAVILLPLFCRDKRSGAYFRFLLVSLLFALPWLVIWPTALYRQAPELFHDWFWLNNIGRFLGPTFGFPALAQAPGHLKYLRDFLWFTLPLWIPALYAWKMLKDGDGRYASPWRDAAVMFPALVVAVGMVLITAAAGQRELYMIPLLMPLALLAARGWGSVPERVNRWLAGVPFVLFSIGLAIVWAAWLGWRCGWPGVLMRRLERVAPGLEAHTGAFSVALALLYSLGWLVLVWWRNDVRRKWPWVWACGITVGWGVAMLLYMPILDYNKGYHSAFAGLMRYLPEAAPEAGRENLGRVIRISSYNLGESQQAILDYYFAVKTRNYTGLDSRPAGYYLLVQNHVNDAKFVPDGTWKKIAETRRPGDRRESYDLYERELLQ